MWNLRWQACFLTMPREIRASALAYVLLASLGLALAAYGQQERALTVAAASESNGSSSDINLSPLKISVNSNLVVVPVTVTDGKGHLVNGLQKEHFTLYEDKVQQPITHFASEDAPVSIGFVVDTSDSMRPRLQKAREAVAALLNNANSQDEFFLVQFNDSAQLLLDPTTETDKIRKHVARMEASGGTALLDGVAVGLQVMRHARHIRKAIILISDGEDNASHYFVQEIRKAVRQENVLIYAIGLGDSSVDSQEFPPRRLTGAALLNDIAEQTGGCLFRVRKIAQLPAVAAKISTWLRSQYVLAYTPSNAGEKAGYRRISVKITKPKGFPRLHAFWRLGYYAPSL